MSADLPVEMFKNKSDRTARILLNLPEPMRAHIDAAAAAGFRTRTAEIVKRLLESMANESIDEHGVIVVRVPRSIK